MTVVFVSLTDLITQYTTEVRADNKNIPIKTMQGGILMANDLLFFKRKSRSNDIAISIKALKVPRPLRPFEMIIKIIITIIIIIIKFRNTYQQRKHKSRRFLTNTKRSRQTESHCELSNKRMLINNRKSLLLSRQANMCRCFL